MRVRSLALGLGVLAILGGGALLLYEVRRPAAVAPPAPDARASLPPPKSAPATPDASALPVPDGAAPSRPSSSPEPPRLRTDAGGYVRVERIGSRDVFWLLDHNAQAGKAGLWANVHDTGYASRDEVAKVEELIRDMISQMRSPDPARPLAEAFPKALAEELQRTIKAPVFLRLDGRAAVWIPQIRFK